MDSILLNKIWVVSRTTPHRPTKIGTNSLTDQTRLESCSSLSLYLENADNPVDEIVAPVDEMPIIADKMYDP